MSETKQEPVEVDVAFVVEVTLRDGEAVSARVSDGGPWPYSDQPQVFADDEWRDCEDDEADTAETYIADAFQSFAKDATKRVVTEVMRERAEQDAKWGVQNHDPFAWLAILSEEVGEAAKAALEARFNLSESRAKNLLAYRAELVQAAAVAVAMVESLDRVEGRENLVRLASEWAVPVDENPDGEVPGA